MEVALAVSLGFFLGVIILFAIIILYGQWMSKPQDTGNEFDDPPGGEDKPFFGLYDFDFSEDDDDDWWEEEMS